MLAEQRVSAEQEEHGRMGTGTITRAELKTQITAVHLVTRGSRQFFKLFSGFCIISFR